MLVVNVLRKLGRAIGCLPTLEACMVPSDTLKSSPQGGAIQASFSSRSMVLVSEIHGIFRNR